MPHPVAEALRPLTPQERTELQRVKRASSEAHLRHQRAVALLAIADGASRASRPLVKPDGGPLTR